MIENWGENSIKTKWQIHIGKSWWNENDFPPWIAKKHPKFRQSNYINNRRGLAISNIYTVFVNQDQTMTNKDIIDGDRIDEFYGNCGCYDLENRYYCTGLLLLNNVESKSSNDDNNDWNPLQEAYWFQNESAKQKFKLNDATYHGVCTTYDWDYDQIISAVICFLAIVAVGFRIWVTSQSYFDV